MTEQIPSRTNICLHLQTWWSIKTMSATAQNDPRQTTDFCVSIDMIFANFYSSLWPWKIKVTLRNSIPMEFQYPSTHISFAKERKWIDFIVKCNKLDRSQMFSSSSFGLSYSWVKVIILHTFPINKYIQRINFYPLRSAIGFPYTYLLDSDFSGASCAIHLLN